MLTLTQGLFIEIGRLLLEMAPYLLFGFSIAGILHVLIPSEKIYQHFSKNNFLSIIKASLFGVPLPLCSCGVIPVTAHLRNQGASKGATMSFLISTPTTGVDSILATYSLLGIVFAIVRPLAAFFAGIFGGVLTNLLTKEKPREMNTNFSCTVCDDRNPHTHKIIENVKVMLRYAFFDLIEDTGKWLVIGISVGGIISYFIPTTFVKEYLSNPLLSYTLMVIIGIPMYVCATGSIPIAASLIAKGMSPGAGLIFLITGPATNSATIAFVLGKLGKKALGIYLFAITFTAILFAMIIDFFLLPTGSHAHIMIHSGMLPQWLKIGSAIILIALIIKSFFKMREKEIKGMGKIYKVPDMECRHCVKTIKDNLSKVNGVEEVRIDLKKKEVQVLGDVKEQMIKTTKQKAGYSIEEEKKS